MKVAVAIPVHKPELNEYEQLSLSRCLAVLRDYPILFFGPGTLDYSPYLQQAPSAALIRFPGEYFASVRDYSELLLSRAFYERFSDVDFVLIHQLDAFVFRDALAAWCNCGYDFIGAPWVQDDGYCLGVGNGGFSLRRIAAFLAVLDSVERESPRDYWAMLRKAIPNRWKRALRYPKKLKRHLGIRDDVRSFLCRFVREGRPEDLFWGLHATRFYKPFRVAPSEAAFDFAIEGGLLEQHERYAIKPPFGCHQERFLRMISRRLNGATRPESEYEALVWRLVESSTQ